MSMIGNLARISEATRQTLHQDPSEICNFLYPEVPATAHGNTGYFGHLFGSDVAVKEPLRTSALGVLPEQDVLDLDKAWHGLHFLFTGSDWEGEFPEGFLVSCGEPIGDEDVGYGPARSFTPEEVAQIATFLDCVDEATLRQRLDPHRMMELEIYPTYPGLRPEDVDLEDEWEYFTDTLHRMKQFVREAAAKNMALLVYIN
ncbi:MAG: YfbM family protein [Limisphaerales bacterium]